MKTLHGKNDMCDLFEQKRDGCDMQLFDCTSHIPNGKC